MLDKACVAHKTSAGDWGVVLKYEKVGMRMEAELAVCRGRSAEAEVKTRHREKPLQQQQHHREQHRPQEKHRPQEHHQRDLRENREHQENQEQQRENQEQQRKQYRWEQEKTYQCRLTWRKLLR